MPLTYEFRCVKCHHTFEMRQAMTAPPPQLCPACDGIDTVERVISGGAGFLLKGGGWFKDGYASNKPEGSRE